MVAGALSCRSVCLILSWYSFEWKFSNMVWCMLYACYIHIVFLAFGKHAWGHPWILHQIASWSNPAHWARNLHRAIQSWGMTLMVSTTTVMCPVKVNSKVTAVPWPVMHLSSWLTFIFKKTTSSFLCSGLQLGPAWCFELQAFWSMFEYVLPTHPVFQNRSRLKWTLPFALHGDEGRGRNHRAVLVISFQPLLAVKGHSFKSRLLHSLFPGERYACLDGVETLECLHEQMANDLLDLFHNGLEACTLFCDVFSANALRYICSFCSCIYDVQCTTKMLLQVVMPNGTKQQIYIAFCGVKGDWPWLSVLSFVCCCAVRLQTPNWKNRRNMCKLFAMFFHVWMLREMPSSIHRF